jgi:TonB family protein
VSHGFLCAAIASVRLWTAIYTWRLPSAVRDVRRAEIEADLWDSAHDPDIGGRWSLPLQLTARLLLGIPDDLGWRLEQVDVTRRRRARTALAGGVLCALTLSVALALSGSPLPPVPQGPSVQAQAVISHPPPTPPPPPPAPGSVAPAQIDWNPIYGRTSYTVASEGAPPRRTKEVRPVYPPIAVMADLQGVVVVQARITEGGGVADARVIQSAGILSQSAMDAVQQWEFAPGAPVQNTLTVKVSFTRSQGNRF